MAAADTARLIASLELKDQFTPGLAKAGSALGRFDARLSRTEGRAFKAGQQIGTGIKNAGKLAVVGVGLLASQVALGLNSLIKLEQAQAQTAAVLKSTGQAAGINAEQVGKLSEKYESYNATVGDETIRQTENLLLTFTNVKKKAFEPALAAILDMNTAMGKGPEGLTTTAIQVGKALNDPAKGFTALRRVGVSFTASQEKRIKALQKEGKLYEAQKIILAELNKEFGGSFLAQGDTTAGKVAKFTDSIEDLQRSLATALLPAIGNVADELSTFLQDPAVIRGAADLGVQIGNLFSRENVGKGIGALREVFQFAKDAAPVVADAAQTMGKVIGTAVSLFKSLPPEIQNLAVAGLAVNKLTGGLVTNIAGGLISSVLKQLVSGVVNVSGAVVNVLGGVPGGGGPDVVPGGKPKKTGIPELLKLLPLLLVAGSIDPERSPTQTEDVPAAIFDLKRAIESASRKNADEISANGKETNGQLITRLTAQLKTLESGVTTAVKTGGSPTSSQARAGMPEVRQWHYDNGRKVTTAVEKLKAEIGKDLSPVPVKLDKIATNTVAAGVAAKNAGDKTKTATVAAGVAAKNAGDKTKAAALAAGVRAAASTRAAGATTAAAARAAGVTAKSGGLASAAAIRAKKLSTTVNVHTRTSVNLSGREWLAQATQTNIRGGAS